NALDGNENRMRARARLGTEEAGLGPEELFHPVLAEDESDSGKIDAAVELLVRGGRDIRHAVAMLVPEAWEGARDVDPEVRGFYRYHACLVEPWDGPAGLVFTDGLGVGAALDRNGLRPLRYAICEDGLVACCSEAGAVDVSGHGRVKRGRLGPGERLFVDPTRGVLFDQECKQRLAAAAPSLKQRFAQVTNPPIDHLRERIVMSLRTLIGPRHPLLSERPEAARLVKLRSFFIYPSTLGDLLDEATHPFGSVLLDATFPVAEGPGGLRRAVEPLAHEPERAVLGCLGGA